MPSSRQLLSEATRDRVQKWCSAGFLMAVVFGLILVLILHLKVDKSFDETRCRCVCPHNLKTTDTFNTTVFLKAVQEATECICENVVPLSSEVLCLQCQCKFETRNKLLIELIIIAVLTTIILMTMYTMAHIILQCMSGKTCSAGTTVAYNHTANINEDISNVSSMDNEVSMSRFQVMFRNRISRDRARGYR